MNKEKRIVVVIGSYPDVGKGVLTSSLAYLIQELGYRVNPYKFDGYMNLSNGTTSPYHKKMAYTHADEELFVLEDGYEANADQGQYERFLNQSLTQANLVSNGHLFQRLFEVERTGQLGYGAKTSFRVIRKMLIDDMLAMADTADFVFMEIGGSVGDRESHIVYEALNFIRNKAWAKVLAVMMSPYLAKPGSAGLLSFRTKIIRQGYEQAWRLGLTPDIIMLRGDSDIPTVKADTDYELQSPTVPIDTKYILAETYLTEDDIFLDPTCELIHQLPALLRKQGIDERILKGFGLQPIADRRTARLETYADRLIRVRKQPETVQIAIFGKSRSYDTYVSLIQAIDHAGVETGIRTRIVWLDNEGDRYLSVLSESKALIVSESIHFSQEKIEALRFAREKDMPVLAISFGLDLLIKEYVTHVLGKDLVIEEIEEGQTRIRIEKTAMEKGSRELDIAEDSMLFRISGNKKNIRERFRHNSVISEAVSEVLSGSALKAVAVDMQSRRPLAFECRDRRFCLAVKYHPEFQSRPMLPHPVFAEMLRSL